MCRLLAVRSSKPFDPAAYLTPFAATARASREFQGDGWGCARWSGAGWDRYRSLTPVWEDQVRFEPTTMLVAHARSAFRNEGIALENNMPFLEEGEVFAFNGELRGVRIVAEGGIGAEKLFRFLRRHEAARGPEPLGRMLEVVARRTRYVRAMNLILATGATLLVASRFSEDPDYFTMHRWNADGCVVIASDPLPGLSGWAPVSNGAVLEFGR